MRSRKAEARRAGLLYLIVLVTAPINLLVIPGRFIVPGDAAATAMRFLAGESVYRMGVVVGLVSNIAFLFVGLALFDLFKDVDRARARAMLVLLAVGVVLGAANLVNQLAPLVLVGGAPFLAVVPRPELESLAYLFLRLRDVTNHVAMAYWGLWLLPLGQLVLRSGFLPRLIGVLLLVGGATYLALSVVAIGAPALYPAASTYGMPLYAVGELSLILWLVVRGATPAPRAAPSTQP